MGLNSTHPFDDNKPCNGKLSGDCLELLNLVLDQEASPGQYKHFEEHLKNCMPCYEKYNIDVAIKKMIREKCADRRVPSGLVETIRAKVLNNTSTE